MFKEGLGTLKGHEAKIFVNSGAQPRFCKARPVPYALRNKVEEELERLEKEGIIEPIQFAEWAAPIVPVIKSDHLFVYVEISSKQSIRHRSLINIQFRKLRIYLRDWLVGDPLPSWTCRKHTNSWSWMRSLVSIL